VACQIYAPLLSATILSTFNYKYYFITYNLKPPAQAIDFPPPSMGSSQPARLVRVKRRFPPPRTYESGCYCLLPPSRCLPPARMSPGKGTEPAGHTSCIAAENDSLPPMCCRLQPAVRGGKERVVQRIVLRCVFKWYNVQQSSNADCSVQEVKNVRRNHACFRTEA
jgi:hypothetical protein